jgi:Ca2+-binding EF-hand superfamily protein
MMNELYAEVDLVLSDPHNLCTQDELYTARNQCLRCFERADKDGNGCLTFDEIEGLCEYMGIPMRGDECEMLRKMDRDDSGTLERGEWVKYWLDKVSRMPNPEKQQGVVAGHTFSQFDKDGSGSIDAVEFRALVTDLGASFSDSEVEAALDQLDSDGDGTVDRSEFVAWWMNRSRDSHAGGVVGLKLKRLASKARAMFHTDIHTAAWKGQLDLVKMFVEGDHRMALAADTEEHGDGFMPLHYACYAGHDDMADFLLLVGGPKVVNAKTDSGFTPLFFAAQQGNVALCEKLLAMGADPSIAGKVVVSDPATGDVRDTGALLCPVDHSKDTPALLTLFQGRERCELPEQLDALGRLHVSFSRSGVLMVTHPAAKSICRLPINAWRVKVNHYHLTHHVVPSVFFFNRPPRPQF